MTKRFSHIIPFVFLLFLLLPILGSLLLQGSRWYLKKSAVTRLEQKQLIQVSLPLASVHWEKEHKELRINDDLFDIKSYTVSNGVLTAIGYFDKEEKVVEHLLSLLAGKGKHHHRLLQLFFVLQCFTATIICCSFCFYAGMHTPVFSRYLFFLPQPPGLIPEQPPRSGAFF